MDLTKGLDDLVAVTLVAALAPLVVAMLPGPASRRWSSSCSAAC